MTEVALATHNIAARKAAARAVAVSRDGAKVANMTKSLFLVRRPTIGPTKQLLQGPCQFEFI